MALLRKRTAESHALARLDDVCDGEAEAPRTVCRLAYALANETAA